MDPFEEFCIRSGTHKYRAPVKRNAQNPQTHPEMSSAHHQITSPQGITEYSTTKKTSKTVTVSSRTTKQISYESTTSTDSSDPQPVRHLTVTSKGVVVTEDKHRGYKSSPKISHHEITTIAEEICLDEDTNTIRVAVLGQTGSGRSSLVQRFLSDDSVTTMAEPLVVTSEHGQLQTVSVVLDGEEYSLLLDIGESLEQRTSSLPDALAVVYSLASKASFRHAQCVLEYLRFVLLADLPCILVANKSDLVRARQVSTEEGVATAQQHACKYVETSVTLNQNCDELLAGIVSQIKLQASKRMRIKKTGEVEIGGVKRRVATFFGKMFGSKERPKSGGTGGLHK